MHTTKSREAEKLIIVSNRLPFVLRKNESTQEWERIASAGGLVTAVAPVVVERKGLWIGWPGVHSNENIKIPDPDPNDKTPTAGLRSDKVLPVNFDHQTFDSYYNGCCNGTFWPLFHSMPDRAQFSAESWKSYGIVNKEFSAKTVIALEMLSKEDMDLSAPLIWIHDYHLMLAANTIRQAAERKNFKFKLAFFLHIPFPSWDIFRLLPWDDEILQGMLGCDMVGFHIEDYCLNFLDCCQRRLGCRVDWKNFLVEHNGRTVLIRALPIGIPFDRFVDMAERAPTVLNESLQFVLGVDRLDYTKGVVHRLKAFELLLERYPQHQSKIALLQISVPSRTDVKEYQDLKEEIDQLIGRINGRFTTPNWSPIKYIYGCVSQNDLASYYRDSSVGMVTPIRDGMNLVAKEFVACQIKKNPGVLIVSPFAGSAETMLEALISNPYEINEAADVLHRALSMPEDERIVRMTSLRHREEIYNVNYWMQSFLKTMEKIKPKDGNNVLSTIMQPITLQYFDDYLSKYLGDKTKLALLLDYDGTLAPLAPHPDLALLPIETKQVLEKLANLPDVHISIISGRNVYNVKQMVGIEGLTYAGNHGIEILHPDGSHFVHPVPKEFEEKSKMLLEKLQEQVCKYGAWVEQKGTFLTFHYRGVPAEAQYQLKSTAQRLIVENGFKADHAHFAIEAKPPVHWDKGRASLQILRTTFGLDWCERVCIIYAGDDTTDEDAMKVLKGMAATFRVDPSRSIKTSAERRLPCTDSVLTMLKWVLKYVCKRLPLEDNNGNLQKVSFGNEIQMENNMPEDKSSN